MNVKRRLKDAGFTQRSFADAIGLHYVTINRWVRAGKMPKWARIFLRTRKVLGKKMHDAIQGDTKESKRLEQAQRSEPWRNRE